MALRVETQTVLRLGRASWPLQPTHLAVNDHGTFVLLAPHNKQFCALLAAQHNLRLPAKASINQSELYQSLLFARRTAENKYQLDQEAARVQEQSSGLFGNADTERAMVEVGSSPRKTRVVRRTRQLRAQAREEQHLLTVNWKNHTLRVLGPGHTTDVPRVLLEDMPRFFAAASAATLTLEDFEPRPTRRPRPSPCRTQPHQPLSLRKGARRPSGPGMVAMWIDCVTRVRVWEFRKGSPLADLFPLSVCKAQQQDP